jgi:DNA (cytosine-5)-methyltransferase 1
MPRRSKEFHELARTDRPSFEEGEKVIRVADLFGGCGGLTLGVAQAATARGVALDIALAVDTDSDALNVYSSNFPKAAVTLGGVDVLFNGMIGSASNRGEVELAGRVGPVDAVIGGPPCQGHSDLNNHTRRDDPRNNLYLRMVRAAEVLRPEVVMIENVPSVRHSVNEVVKTSMSELSRMGYLVAERVVLLSNLGVPQMRKRHVVLACHSGAINPAHVLNSVADARVSVRTVKWAIGDLAKMDVESVFDGHPKASERNLARMRKMLRYNWFDLPNGDRPPCHQNEEHSYKSMYGRLDWSKPAQTITSGFSSIGQGRYMHPDQPRWLTAHEAARLQGFPDYFDFSSVTKRTSLSTMIGNAVPPALASAIFGMVIPALSLST